MPSPAFQFYPDDFVGSGIVQAAEADEIGAYVLLLCLDWTEDGFAFDEPRLARVCRISVRRFRKVWSHLKEKFPLGQLDNKHRNTRLQKERKKQEEWRLKSSEAGRKGADARWHPPAKEDDQPHANAMTTAMRNGLPKHDSPVSSLQSPSPELLTTTAPTPLLPEPPAKVRPAVNWPASVAASWTRQIGPRSFGRVGNDLKLFADQFADPADAERALLAAVDNFARHRRLAMERGIEKPDNWPQFVRDLLDYVPPPLKPKAVAA